MQVQDVKSASAPECGTIDELMRRDLVDDALKGLSQACDNAIEALRDALVQIDNDDARIALEGVVDEADEDLTAAIRKAKSAVGI